MPLLLYKRSLLYTYVCTYEYIYWIIYGKKSVINQSCFVFHTNTLHFVCLILIFKPKRNKKKKQKIKCQTFDCATGGVYTRDGVDRFSFFFLPTSISMFYGYLKIKTIYGHLDNYNKSIDSS